MHCLRDFLDQDRKVEAYSTAVSYLKKALKSDEEDLMAKFWLGLSYYAIGDEKKAKTYLNLLKCESVVEKQTNS